MSMVLMFKKDFDLNRGKLQKFIVFFVLDFFYSILLYVILIPLTLLYLVTIRDMRGIRERPFNELTARRFVSKLRPLSVSTDNYPRTRNTYVHPSFPATAAAAAATLRKRCQFFPVASRRRVSTRTISSCTAYMTSESNNKAPPPS